jgi:hypothetical protein
MGARAEDARKQNAHWFGVHRTGGAMMLYHRHLAVLLPRDMSTTGATADSSRTGNGTVKELSPPDKIEYLRPIPAPLSYLDVATEPVPLHK